MRTGSKADAEGMLIASGLVPADRTKGDDAADTRLLRKMSEDAERYISSFSWCGSILDSYFGGGTGGLFAVFFFHIRPSRRGISPWIWVMVGDVPSSYLPLDDCRSPLEALDVYIQGMGKWVRLASQGKTGTAQQGVPPVNVPATPEWAEQLDQRLKILASLVRPFFLDASKKACGAAHAGKRSARRLAALGGIAPNFPEIPRRKASKSKPRGQNRPH